MVAVPLPAEAELIVGAPGIGAAGVTLIVPDGGPLPFAFLAVMEQV